MKKKKLLSVVCALSMMISPQMMNVNAVGNVSEPAAVVTVSESKYATTNPDGVSGTIFNAEWKFDASTGTLSITSSSGKTTLGKIPKQEIPWIGFADKITKINIDEKIDYSSTDWLASETSITDFTLSSRNRILTGRFFENCSRLETVIIPENISHIYNDAMINCSSLKSVTILNPDCEIKDNARTICNTYDSDTGKAGYSGVIRGYDNSTAQKYAEKYGYKFESLGSAPVEGGTTTTTIVYSTIPRSTTTTAAAATSAASVPAPKELSLTSPIAVYSYAGNVSEEKFGDIHYESGGSSASTITADVDIVVDGDRVKVENIVCEPDSDGNYAIKAKLTVSDTAPTGLVTYNIIVKKITDSDGNDITSYCSNKLIAPFVYVTEKENISALQKADQELLSSTTKTKTTTTTTTTTAAPAAVTTTTSAGKVNSEIKFGLPDKYEYLPREEDGVMLYIRANGTIKVSGAEELSTKVNSGKYNEVRDFFIEAFSEAVENIKGTYTDYVTMLYPLKLEVQRICKEKGFDEKTGYKLENISINSLTFTPAVTTTTTTGTTTTTTAPVYTTKTTTTSVNKGVVSRDMSFGTQNPVPYNYNGKDYDIRFFGYLVLSYADDVDLTSSIQQNIKANLLDQLQPVIGTNSDTTPVDKLEEKLEKALPDVIKTVNEKINAIGVTIVSADDIQLSAQEVVRKTTTTTVLPTTAHATTTTTTAMTTTNSSDNYTTTTTNNQSGITLEVEPVKYFSGKQGQECDAGLYVIRYSNSNNSSSEISIDCDIKFENDIIKPTKIYTEKSSIFADSYSVKAQFTIPEGASGNIRYEVNIRKITNTEGEDITSLLVDNYNLNPLIYVRPDTSSSNTTTTTAAATTTTATTTTAADSQSKITLESRVLKDFHGNPGKEYDTKLFSIHYANSNNTSSEISIDCDIVFEKGIIKPTRVYTEKESGDLGIYNIKAQFTIPDDASGNYNYKVNINKITNTEGEDITSLLVNYAGAITKICVDPDTSSTNTTTTAATTTTTSTTTTTTTTVTTTTPVSTPDGYTLGDVDNNGIIDGRDATAVLTEYAKTSTGAAPTFTETQTKAADVNLDGIIDGRDASILLMYYAKISTNQKVSLADFAIT